MSRYWIGFLVYWLMRGLSALSVAADHLAQRCDSLLRKIEA